jgi:MFS family permease
MFGRRSVKEWAERSAESKKPFSVFFWGFAGLAVIFSSIASLLWLSFRLPDLLSGSIPVLTFLTLFYALAIIAMLPYLRARYRSANEALEDVNFEIDLLQFQGSKIEGRAEKILRINQTQLRRYYDLNLSQNIWVFGLGIFCIILGFIVITITLYLVLNVAQSFNTQIITAAVGTIGSILVNFVAAIYLRMHAGATDTLGRFHSRLVETHQALLGNLLASRVENDKQRWDTLSQLSLNLIKHDQQPVVTPSQKLS